MVVIFGHPCGMVCILSNEDDDSIQVPDSEDPGVELTDKVSTDSASIGE